MTQKADKGHPKADDGREKRLDSLLPEAMRKALVTGLGAIFMTEESLRGLVAEMRLPKEAAGYLVKQADAARGQLVDAVTKEIGRVVESINIGAEIQKILTSVVIEVKTEIRLVPAEDGLVKPKVSTTVHARRAREPKDRDGRGREDREPDAD
jgi:hypothetical protein